VETLKFEVDAQLRHRLRQHAAHQGRREDRIVSDALDAHLAIQELSQYREIKLSQTDAETPVHTPREGSVDRAGAIVRIASIERSDGSRHDEHISHETFESVLNAIFGAVDEPQPPLTVGDFALRLRPVPDRRVVEVHVMSDRDDLALDAPPTVMSKVAELLEGS